MSSGLLQVSGQQVVVRLQREVGEVDVVEVEVDGEDEAAARSLRAEGSAKPWEGNQ